jgi:hypothetical protein
MQHVGCDAVEALTILFPMPHMGLKTRSIVWRRKSMADLRGTAGFAISSAGRKHQFQTPSFASRRSITITQKYLASNGRGMKRAMRSAAHLSVEPFTQARMRFQCSPAITEQLLG